MTQRIPMIAFLLAAAVMARADSPSAVVAKINNTTLTEDQMKADVGPDLYEAENNAYHIKKNWIDQKAKEILFTQAAKDANLSLADWQAKEITSKVSMPSDDDIKKVADPYAKQTNTTDPNALAQQRQMIVGQMMNQKRMERENELVKELEKKYPVQISLVAPVAPVIDVKYGPDDPSKGPKNAPVTIVEYTDFQCPYCKRSQDTLHQVEDNYKGKVKLVVRQYPLPFHNRARPAAEASLCAKEQGKFWEMHDKLFPSQTLEDADIKKFAGDIGLNQKKFDECLASHRYNPQIDRDIAEGQKIGVRGTPAFFVNGVMINGAQPYSEFQSKIDDALGKKS